MKRGFCPRVNLFHCLPVTLNLENPPPQPTVAIFQVRSIDATPSKRIRDPAL